MKLTEAAALSGGLLAMALSACFGVDYASGRWEALRAWKGPSGSYVVISDEELFGALDLSRPGLDGVKGAAEKGRFDEAYAAWARYWAQRTRPVWVFDADAYRRAMNDDLPWLTPIILEQADKVLRREIVAATYPAKPKGKTFDWAADNGDSAYIGWHYFFWFRALARAYALTGDERYAQAVADIVVEWHDALPDIKKFEPVVWNSMLGSSLRATYFVEAYCVLRGSPALTPQVHAAMLRVLLGHARYIHDRHMQKYTFWNGQNSAAAWLTAAYLMLPEFKEAAAWRAATIPIIRQHFEKDFRADGGQSELCEQYHMTGLRDLWTALRLMQRNGDLELPNDRAVMDKFHKAFLWPLALSLPDGKTPALNSGVYASEWLIFAGLAHAFYDDPTLRWALRRFVKSGWVPLHKGFPPTSFWLIDETFAAALRDARPAAPPPFTSVLLRDSGFGALRDNWERDASVMVLDFGQPTGGHGYPGKLSFVLYAKGAPVALQPGSPLSYSLPVYGKWCYQTVSHNTVVVNDHSPPRPFNADLARWHDLGHVVFVGARTDVYQKSDGVVHRRFVTFLPGEYFALFDLLEGNGQAARLRWMFHCPQPLKVDDQKRVHTPEGQPGVMLIPSRPADIEAVTQGVGHSAVPVEWRPGFKSEDSFRDDVPYIGYAKSIAAGSGGQTYGVLIAPFKSALPKADVRALEPSGATSLAAGLVAAWPEHDDWHLVSASAGKLVEWDEVATDAAQVAVRFPRAAGELPSLIALAGGSALRVRGKALVEANGVRALALQRTASGWRGQVETDAAAALRLLAPHATEALVDAAPAPLSKDGDYATLSLQKSAQIELRPGDKR